MSRPRAFSLRLIGSSRGGTGTTLPAGSFSALGMGGQFLTVIPHLDLTVVGLIDTSVAFEDLTQAGREDVYMRLLEIAERRT